MLSYNDGYSGARKSMTNISNANQVKSATLDTDSNSAHAWERNSTQWNGFSVDLVRPNAGDMRFISDKVGDSK